MAAKKLSGGGACGCVGGPGMATAPATATIAGGAAKAAKAVARAARSAAKRAAKAMRGGCACDAPAAAPAPARFAGGFLADPWAKLLVLLQVALVLLIGGMAWTMWASRRGAPAAGAADASAAAAALGVHHAGYVRGPAERPPMRGGDIRNAPDLRVNPARDPAYPLRGVPQDYQQMGTIVSAAPDASPDAQPTILPLIGRPSPTNRDRWNYYTATDQYNMMRLPIAVDGKDCQEDVGCREIYNGDAISVPAYKKEFTAQVYKYERPQYNPTGPSTVTLAI